MRMIIALVLYLGIGGCATLPQESQPSLKESYGIIKAGNGIFFESIDEKHFGLGLYGYKGDVRVYPGEHVIQMHYDSPGILVHYSGSKLPLTINVKEGKRYYIGAEVTRNWGVSQSWKPIVVKEEEIEGYGKNKSNQ